MSRKLTEKELNELPVTLAESIFGLERDRKLDGLVAEIDKEARSSMTAASKFSADGLVLPLGLLSQVSQTRSLVPNIFSAGGALFASEVSKDIDMALRPFSAAVKAGARMLEGLRGDVVL